MPELAVFVLVQPLMPVLLAGATTLESFGLVVTNLVSLALTDDVWRRESVTDVIGEVREAVAVRARYLHGIVEPVAIG